MAVKMDGERESNTEGNNVSNNEDKSNNYDYCYDDDYNDYDIIIIIINTINHHQLSVVRRHHHRFYSGLFSVSLIAPVTVWLYSFRSSTTTINNKLTIVDYLIEHNLVTSIKTEGHADDNNGSKKYRAFSVF